MEWVPAGLDGTGWKLRAPIDGAAVRTGAVAGIPGMDAHPVTRYRAETAHPTDLEGEAGGGFTC